ncbi:MAG TPA: RNA polymerase sigma factor [Candidatus Limnocylindrales bacterium]|nr:RNA polymerase sigma factor [Candidatus Limnocylindrales bacterium]
MTEGLDVSGLRSESVVFRLEISDFGAFYERTYAAAYRTALGIVRDPSLAADVTQEAYVAAYRHRHRYRGEAPSTAWLHRIVVNQALSALRRRRATVRDLSPSMVPDDAGGTVARMALLQALDALPARHRAAVILRYYHDYDYATIARFLNTTSTNVGAMLSRSLDRLKDALEPEPGVAAETGR